MFTYVIRTCEQNRKSVNPSQTRLNANNGELMRQTERGIAIRTYTSNEANLQKKKIMISISLVKEDIHRLSVNIRVCYAQLLSISVFHYTTNAAKR